MVTVHRILENRVQGTVGVLFNIEIVKMNRYNL